MLDTRESADEVLKRLRLRFAERAPSLPEIFDAGDDILALPAPADGVGVTRIAVAGSLTTDFIARAVAVGAALEGQRPVIYQAPFGSYVQEVLDPSSGLNRFHPDIVILAPDWRDVVDDLLLGSDEAARAVSEKLDLFRALWGHFTDKLRCRILQHTIAPPPRRWGGVAERLSPSSPIAQINQVNDGLLKAGAGRVTIIDVERLAAEIGLRKFAPNRFYHQARLGFETKWLPDYLAAFRGALRAALGRTKKVLALDLDNTLWGGVIGDDGVEGIKLGPGSAAGEAFQEWQAYLRDLRARGVVLTACSKNSPNIAETGFNHHSSVLRRDDFAVFACSWDDKAQGLRRIAKELNVGIDSIVFCDDNPAECALVRDAVPEVAVVHLGADPTAFIDLLEAGHWFDQSHYTVEDLGRGEMYAARAKATSEAAAATDIGGFLRGLKMVGRVHRPAEADMARVAQLEMKTNQFNVTTRRYSEPALRAFMERDDATVLSLWLSDRFGDHGLVSTLIAVREGDALRIDSWLMSCRVFSRGAEQFVMRELVDIARAQGAARIVGEFVATERNGVVADLWSRLGFAEQGGGLWTRAAAADPGDLAHSISK